MIPTGFKQNCGMHFKQPFEQWHDRWAHGIKS